MWAASRLMWAIKISMGRLRDRLGMTASLQGERPAVPIYERVTQRRKGLDFRFGSAKSCSSLTLLLETTIGTRCGCVGLQCCIRHIRAWPL